MSDLDVAQITELEQCFSAFYVVTVTFSGILIYDWLITLPDEIVHIWRAPQTLLVKWLYLFTKYWSIIVSIVSLVSYLKPASDGDCNHLILLLKVIPIPLILGYQSLLVIRCASLFNYSMGIFIPFSALGLVEAGVLSYLPILMGLPSPLGYTHTCILRKMPRHPWLPFIFYFWTQFIVNAAIFLLFIQGCCRARTEPGIKAFCRKLYEEGALYMLGVFITSLVAGLIPLVARDMPNFLALPAVVTNAILACRMVIAVRKSQKPPYGCPICTFAIQKLCESGSVPFRSRWEPRITPMRMNNPFLSESDLEHLGFSLSP